MKKILKFLSIVFFFTMISCGSSDKKASDEQKSIENKGRLELTLEFKSTLNDKFNIYYTTDPNVDITGENILKKYIYASPEMQKIVFQFPEAIIPYKLRLDVGENQNANEISIKNISLNYNDKIIDGDNGTFMEQWSSNESLQYDTKNFIYKVMAVDGKKSPVFIANLELEKQLRKLRNN